ncbi:MAG TPA: AIR synthase-related protein [Thermomicrobiales bacterium]|jgi:hydrogenase maturation factor
MSAQPDALPIGKLPGDLLARLIAGHVLADPAVVVGPGIGRDAAAIEIGDVVLVVKTDPITFASETAAQYLVDVNANDLACLGATPRWLLVTALLPEGRTTQASVESLFRDLQKASQRRGIALVGGHTEVTAGLDRVILVGQLLGLAPKERLLVPGGAKPGDRLLLTKALAIEGTALLARERPVELTRALGRALVDRASALLVDPGISVVTDAEVVRSAGGVTSLHDPTEGGFATGIRELAQASGCGAVVNESLIPVLPETRAIAAYYRIDPLGMLASGSLLASVSPSAVPAVERACLDHGIAFSWIGKLTSPERGITLLRDGRPVELAPFTSDEVARALAASAR